METGPQEKRMIHYDLLRILAAFSVVMLHSAGQKWYVLPVTVPEGMTSWEFFDCLLERANVVGTPGSGFGPSGEGYFRLTAFGSYENTVEAVDRIRALQI